MELVTFGCGQQAVNDTADIQASLTSAEMVAARQHAANLALLPRTFDSIRAMFGHTGPSIIPRQQVGSIIFMEPAVQDASALLLLFKDLEMT